MNAERRACQPRAGHQPHQIRDIKGAGLRSRKLAIGNRLIHRARNIHRLGAAINRRAAVRRELEFIARGVGADGLVAQTVGGPGAGPTTAAIPASGCPRPTKGN